MFGKLSQENVCDLTSIFNGFRCWFFVVYISRNARLKEGKALLMRGENDDLKMIVKAFQCQSSLPSLYPVLRSSVATTALLTEHCYMSSTVVVQTLLRTTWDNKLY